MKLLLPTCAVVIALCLAACDSDTDGDRTVAMSPVETATVASIPSQPPTTPTIVAPTATLIITPPATPPTVGSSVLIPIRITGATNLAAFQFTPVFDESILELVNITDAGFAGSTGRVPTCSSSRMERTTYFCVSGGAQPPGPSGEGDLAVMEFRALAPGATQIALESISATMPDAADIPLTTEPVTVTVQ